VGCTDTELFRTLKREQMVVVGKTRYRTSALYSGVFKCWNLTILQLSREYTPRTRDSLNKVPAVFLQASTVSTMRQIGVAAAPLTRRGHLMPMQGKGGVALQTKNGCSTLSPRLRVVVLWEASFLQILKLMVAYAAWFLMFSQPRLLEQKLAVAQLVYNTCQMLRQVLRNAVHQRKL